MPVEVQSQNESPSVTSLVKGIVNDVGDLIKQEFRFARTELKTDLRRTGEASRFLLMGIVVTFLGLGILALMLVHLLHWLSVPAGSSLDPAGLPLWACHAIVGFLILATGAALAVAGKKKFDSFNPLPDETIKTVEENLNLEDAKPWTANSK
jgi:hypothetical protein